MSSRLVICDELAKAADSKLVKDMMLVHYRRELQVTFQDEADLRSKTSEISGRVDCRDKTMKELQLLFGSESGLKSIAGMMRMQTEDLTEVARLLHVVTQKHVRLRCPVGFQAGVFWIWGLCGFFCVGVPGTAFVLSKSALRAEVVFFSSLGTDVSAKLMSSVTGVVAVCVSPVDFVGEVAISVSVAAVSNGVAF